MSEKIPLEAYVEAEPPGWGEAVDTWPWRSEKSGDGGIIGYSKYGNCPRCGGPTLIETGLILAIQAVTDNSVYARCECEAIHEVDKRGCGAAAMIEGPG